MGQRSGPNPHKPFASAPLVLFRKSLWESLIHPDPLQFIMEIRILTENIFAIL